MGDRGKKEMENENINENINENVEKAVTEPVREVKPKHSKIVPVLAFICACSVIFSMLQTVYILRLASGSVGNMSYVTEPDDNGHRREDDTEPSVSPVADPEFSLERAASVTDPNKTTLSTTEIVTLVSPATVSLYVLAEVGENANVPMFSGTGFFISEDGYIVTNEHVVSDVVEDSSYRLIADVPGYDIPFDAVVVGTDFQTDVAVVKIEPSDEPFPYVTLGDSDTLQTGELVVAIGNPFGRFEGTVTVGVVSALNRQINNSGYTMNLIQTDASINSGNSGGPLINSFGEVIGITNAKISVADNLGFAIPISDVIDEIQSIINYGYVANRPYLGVTVGNVASNAYYGAIEGVYVAGVDVGGPADEAGLREGDRIISIDGVEIGESDDIISVRDLHLPGDEITVVIERDGRTRELTLVVGDSYDAE